MTTGITGFVRVPDSLDPNKVYALGPNGRPINNEQDLMALTGGKTVAQAWQLANVQLVSPEDALNKYNVTDANAKRAGTITTNNTQNNQQTTTTTEQKQYIRNPNTNDVYDRNGNHITVEQVAQIPDFWNQVEVTDTAPATGGNVPGGTTTINTGNDTLNAMYKEIADLKAQIEASGKKINPAIVWASPEGIKKLAEFTSQVADQLSPYYTSQFNAIKGDLSTDLNYLSTQYKTAVDTAQETFKQNLATSRENAAGAGTIFSGARKVNEQSLADTSARNMESLGTDLTYKAQKTGTAAEQNIGSTNLAGLNSPTYKSYNISSLGEGQYVPLSDRNLFNPTGGVIGSLEREKYNATESEMDKLRNYYLSGLAV